MTNKIPLAPMPRVPALPLVMFWFPDTGDVADKATKERHEAHGGWIADAIELGYELKELHLIRGDFDTGIYASDNGEIKIRRNCRSWGGYEIVEA